MSKTFEGKNVLVTGGTSGIGKATAIAFADAGAKVVVTGAPRKKKARRSSPRSRTREEPPHSSKLISLRKPKSKAAVDFVVATFGRLNIAFNNAGLESVGSLSEVTEDTYRKVFDINVWGVLAAMKHEVTAMLKSGGGAIVNTSSTFGHVGAAQVTIYVASKHAVEGMTKCVALEFAQQNIRVNAISPAAIETDMIDRFAGKEGEARDALIAKHPIGRLEKAKKSPPRSSICAPMRRLSQPERHWRSMAAG